ncbi:hypothetical protein D3C81_1395250 [compost metagenome]
MIVEPAGFLAFAHRGLELDAVLFQRDPVGHFAVDGFDIALQAFRVTRGGIVLEQDAARLEHLDQGCDHVVLVLFHGGRSQLHHEDVEEAVDDQARQQVGITVDQAVAWLVEQALTQRQRDVEAMYQQRFVQRQLDVTRQQAGADQVVRAQCHDTQRLAVGGLEDRLLAGLQALQRGRDDVDFIAVDPQVAGAQAAVGIGFEAKAGQGHDVAPGKRAGL